MIWSSDFDKIKFEIQNLLKNVISKRMRLFVKKQQRYNFLKLFFCLFLWEL